jgi:hypothetical protein
MLIVDIVAVNMFIVDIVAVNMLIVAILAVNMLIVAIPAVNMLIVDMLAVKMLIVEFLFANMLLTLLFSVVAEELVTESLTNALFEKVTVYNQHFSFLILFQKTYSNTLCSGVLHCILKKQWVS